uniref:Putative vesicle-associated membrane protein-associated protein n=1 Tax=Tabanus bromius TaxID=304241 RepID=A0A0K8TP53_TABBR
MEKKEQLLVIDPPNELKFRGPFTRPVTTVMTLTNPTNETILFKIKTTAPRKYCVRPNFGSLEPNSSINVTICLQVAIFDPNEKNKHKFMVQSLVVPDNATDIDKIWREVQPDQLMDSKLRCVFELPVDNNAPKAVSGDSNGPSEVTAKDTSVKAGGDEKQFDVTHSDYEKAIAEVQQLRIDESQLRQENMQLKEQLIRLKAELKERTANPQNAYSPPQIGQQQQVQIVYIAIAVSMAIVGLVLGKLLL